jgi:PAS domain S-box-containing protein
MNRSIASPERQVLVITANYDEHVRRHLLLESTDILEHRQNRYQIQQSESPLAALEICFQEVPACIFLDWELPNLDAEKFLQQIPKQIPVVILVSAVNEELISHLEVDYQDYVVKEALTKELVFSAIRNAIAQEELKQQLIHNRLHNRSDALLELQNRCLGCIAMGDSLVETFNLLSQLIELQINDALCSIVFFDDQGKLNSVTSQSLPNNLHLTINGISIGEATSLFGNTIEGKAINIGNLDNYHWQEYRNLVLANGFKTCWATPIFARDGHKVLGFFTLYYRESLKPSLDEIKVIKNTAYAAGIAIERDRSESNLQQQLQREQQLYQQLQQELHDRKQAELSLQENQQFIQKISETSPNVLYLYNVQEQRIIYLNRMNYSALGYTAQEIQEMGDNPFLNLMHPDDLAKVATALELTCAAADGELIDTEYRLRHANGEWRWRYSRNSVFSRDNRGEVLITMGTVHDITDRKIAEIRLQQQTEHQKLLSIISQRIRASLNLEEILNTTVAEIHQLLQSDRVLVCQIYSNATRAVITESVSPGFTSILDNIYSETTLPKDVYDSLSYGEIYSVEDIESQPFTSPMRETLRGIQVRAILLVPIIQDQQLWGLLVAQQCDRPRHWQDWEIDLMQQLSSQFAIAIQQASLYQQLQLELRDRQHAEELIRQQADRESLLREITQRIRQSLDLHTIFETATLEIRQFLHADRVGIFKFAPKSDFNNGEFVAESVVDGFDSVLKIPIHDDCFGEQYSRSYRHGRYQAVGDIYNAGLSQCHMNILSVFQIRANLVVPLLNGSVLWGLICIHQCSSPRHWEADEVILIQQISNQLAIAIQQANLYQQVQEELANKETLYIQLANELHQKKVLLKEVHHRVKNNLQVMSSLLRMQFRKTTPDLKILIEDYQNRIQSMALIHAQLHRNDDLASIDFHDYISDLLSNLFQCYGNTAANIQYKLDVINIFLPLDQSIPLGLIINELISNTLKYAFPHGSGEINIQLMQTKYEYHLIVADNGIGIPQEIDLENTDSLGMQLVHSLTEQLEGNLIYSSEYGTKFQLIFPVI